MNCNYDKTQIILEGTNILYNMLRDITESINHLPGCRMTEKLKRAAVNIGADSECVYQTIKNLAAEMGDSCDDCIYDTDEDYNPNTHTSADLQKFFDLIDRLLVSSKPISISADIYIDNVLQENGVDECVV